MVSVCRVLGFWFEWNYFGGLGFPRPLPQKDAKVPFGGLSQYPSGHQGLTADRPWSQFPLLKWDDDDRWETVSNVDVCMKTCVKQIPNFDDVDFGKITCNMVVQFDCLGFMVSCPRLHEGPKSTSFEPILFAPLPLPYDDQRWSQRDQCLIKNPSLRAPMTHKRTRCFMHKSPT